MKNLALAFLFLIGLTSIGFAQSLPEWSIWKNQRTSLLVVTKVNSDGSFIGTFINNAAGYRCIGVPAATSGKVTGTDVVFVANFAPCDNTITAWKGTLAGNTLTTSWDLWNADSNGDFHESKEQDIFTKIN